MVALSLANMEARPSGVPQKCTAKLEMAMSCMGVVAREVGVKCCRVQGCCVCVRPGGGSCWSMVMMMIAFITKKSGLVPLIEGL